MEPTVAFPVHRAIAHAPAWSSSMAAVLEDQSSDLTLMIDIDPASGMMAATLQGPGIEAVGWSPVTLDHLSNRTVTVATTIELRDRNRSAHADQGVEACLSLAWTIDRADPTAVEVAGAALLSDLDGQHLIPLRAVRRHPANRLGADEFEAGGGWYQAETPPRLAPHRRARWPIGKHRAARRRLAVTG